MMKKYGVFFVLFAILIHETSCTKQEVIKRPELFPQKTKIALHSTISDQDMIDTVTDLKNTLVLYGADVVRPDAEGQADLTFTFELAPQLTGNDPGQVSITRTKNSILFKGSSLSALKHGVYTYIRDRLHTVWYMPSEEIYFSNDGVNDPLFESPGAIEYRLPFLTATQYWGQSSAWHRRMREITDRKINAMHIWHRVLPPQEYFEKHPEYYALINGKREPAQLCTTNQEVIKIFINSIITYFSKHPDIEVYSLSPEDNFKFCECPNCRALDVVEGSITDRLIVFFNAVAEGVTKYYPNKKLAFYAYLNYTEPPVNVLPHSALIPVICHTPWEFCHNHAITDPQCWANARFRKVVEGWVKFSSEVYIREYYGHFYWYGLWPILHSIEADMDFYRAVGIKGIISESHEHWGVAGWVLYGAGCYLAGDTGSWKNMIDRYCTDVCRGSSPWMKQYITLLEEKSQAVPCRRMDLLFDNESVPHLISLMNAATKNARSPDDKKATKLYADGLTVTLMLIGFHTARSAGNIERMVAQSHEIMQFINERAQNTTVPPVIKYALAKKIVEGMIKKSEEERTRFFSYFENRFKKRIEKYPAVFPIREWMATKPYPNVLAEQKEGALISMYPPLLEEERVLGLDTAFAPEKGSGRWENVTYPQDFFTLYEYFPFRPDSIRYYRKVISLPQPLKGVFMTRVVDGYTFFIDEKPVFHTKMRRFKKKELFDFIPVDLSSGSHEIMVKLESSEHMEKDDFTVVLFDSSGRSLNLK